MNHLVVEAIVAQGEERRELGKQACKCAPPQCLHQCQKKSSEADVAPSGTG